MHNRELLKQWIGERYRSEAQAARVLGWSRQRLNRITNGRKEPDLDEVNALARLLGKPWGEVAAVFLSQSHQMGNKRRGERRHGRG